VTAKGTKVQVASSQRHHWLYQGHCAGDRSRPINHCLKLPPAYFSELDELAALDSPSMSLRPVTEEWQSQQPEVVHHVTNVLLTHSYKVSCALAGTSMQRSKDRRRVAAHLGGSSPSSDSDSERDSPSTGSRGRSKYDSSDWSEDYRQDHVRPPEERWGSTSRPSRPRTDPRSLMADALYVEIIRVLLNPQERLEELTRHQPSLALQMRRLLLHRHRFQLFWAHVYLVSDNVPESSAVARLVPILCHVDGKCKVEKPEWTNGGNAVLPRQSQGGDRLD